MREIASPDSRLFLPCAQVNLDLQVLFTEDDGRALFINKRLGLAVGQ